MLVGKVVVTFLINTKEIILKTNQIIHKNKEGSFTRTASYIMYKAGIFGYVICCKFDTSIRVFFMHSTTTWIATSQHNTEMVTSSDVPDFEWVREAFHRRRVGIVR